MPIEGGRVGAALDAELSPQREGVKERSDTAEISVLRIQLAPMVSADQLRSFLALTGRLYFDALWLGLAENDADGAFPDEYTPREDEQLWIHRLEIGTPNVLELIGQLEPLREIAEFLAVVGGSRALERVSHAALNFARARNEWNNIAAARKAGALRSKGKISDAALKQKQMPPADRELANVLWPL